MDVRNPFNAFGDTPISSQSNPEPDHHGTPSNIDVESLTSIGRTKTNGSPKPKRQRRRSKIWSSSETDLSNLIPPTSDSELIADQSLEPEHSESMDTNELNQPQPKTNPSDGSDLRLPQPLNTADRKSDEKSKDTCLKKNEKPSSFDKQKLEKEPLKQLKERRFSGSKIKRLSTNFKTPQVQPKIKVAGLKKS